jgi:hypothetical protein
MGPTSIGRGRTPRGPPALEVAMTTLRFRSPVVLLAILSAVVLAVTSMLAPAVVSGVEKLVANIALAADQGWIMGGTGLPDPTVGTYMDQVEGLYLQPPSPLFDGQPTFDTYDFAGLTTPEQFCPFVCLPPPNPQLNFGDSLAQGVDDLNNAVVPALQDGDNVAAFGFSQSATIATLEMQNLIDDTPAGVDLSDLHIVLIGDPNNPIGGMLDRFQFPDGIKAFSLDSAPQHIPFVNIPLSIGATPTDDIPTDIYSAEYDGWANFPADPTNLLADINALLGILVVHGGYPTFDNLGDTIDLGSIGEANFYMIPEQLPILSWMYQVPYALPVFADAMAPGLTLNIDWAYGNPGDPDAGIPLDGVDPIGTAGPWAVTATGQLAEDSGVAGFLPKMDPLQMLAGLQYAGVHSLVDPVNEILREAGQSPLPQSVVDTMLGLSGYDLTNDVDAFVLNGWNELATALHVEDFLGPDAIFDGTPLISGQPLIDLLGVGFDVFNFFGA